MESALFDQVTVDILSFDQKIQFRATGTTQVFDGFLRLYQEGVDDEGDQEDDHRKLPVLTVDETTPLSQVTPNQHFTQPPPRFTEASLVKKLEELGIGRPSTYAAIIHVLQERNYVRLEKKQFIAEERGRMVTSFLVNFFRRYVEYDFTAHMEEQLDEISNGQLNWKHVLTSFWEEFKTTVDGTKNLRISEVLDCLERDMQMHLFHSMDESARQCPSCHEGHISLKLSKFGAFLGCSRYPECKYTRAVTADGESAELSSSDEPKVIGLDPESGDEISLRKGPYGYYLQWGSEQEKGKKPKRVAITQGIDLNSVDLSLALSLKDLPKIIGHHPNSGEAISVGIGKFGPYVKYGSLYASIPRRENMFELSLERALELIADKQKKSGDKSKTSRKKK
jgi:DNA topoisomerase-1